MTASDYAQHLKPRVAEVLRAVGLDVVYDRAAGDHLFHGDTPVVDFLGGYGASLLGHNHPELVAVARRVLDEQRPFNAQASVRALAGQLAARLSERVGQTTGKRYVATFAATGAAAVEAAIKHAEMELVERIDGLLAENARAEKRLRIGLKARTASLPFAVLAQAEALLGGEPILTLDELCRRVLEHNLEVFGAGPTFLTLERGFHGKSTGALSITANPRYRKIWRRLGLRTAFLKPGDEGALEAALARATVSYLALDLDEHGRLVLVSRPLVNVVGCFVEPIQGEGGVHEIPAPFLARLRVEADRAGFPLVFDEIQCGLGRTGTFLGSAPSGVRADYYLFSKSLGGGLAKVSAMLVERERYLPDFGLLHTSTFAEDDFASAVALRALELIDDELLAGCAAKGAHLLARLRELQRTYPDQIVGVRGRGLMVGIELAPQITTRSTFLRVASEQELLGYVVAGFLLAQHGLRVAPTLSSPNTLRIQPSALIPLRELDRLCDALEDVVRALRAGDGGRLVAHLTAGESVPAPPTESGIPPLSHFLSSAERVELASGPVVRPRPSVPARRKVAFLAHFLEPGDVRAWDPSLAAFDDGACARLLDRIRGLIDPFVTQRASVRSASGAEVEVTMIGLPFTAQQVMASFKGADGAWIRDMLEHAVALARAEDAEVIGFGGYTSILTRNCLDVLEDRALLTSGNSLTAAAAVEATLAAVRRLGLPRITLGVVGALGNIGSVLAEVLAPSVGTIVLVGKPAARRRLEARAAELRGRIATEIVIATDMTALRACNVVVTATNSPQHVILPEHIADGPVVVCDIATPGDVSPELIDRRPRAVLLKGGLVRLPLGQHLAVDGMQLPRGHVYGCLAETLLIALAGLDESLSLGDLDADGIRRAAELARAHGFDIALRPLFKPVPTSQLTELACSSA